MLIKNFGHLWERKYINFGRPKVRGHLRGYISDSIVDFRGQIGIYALYDKDFIPVYVGQAGNGHAKLFDRLKKHETDHLWNRWDSFSWFGVRGVNQNRKLSEHDKVEKLFKSPGSVLLNEFEAVLIAAMEPKLNKQGPRWNDVKEYFQHIDKTMEDIKLSDVIAQQEALETLIMRLDKKVGRLAKPL